MNIRKLFSISNKERRVGRIINQWLICVILIAFVLSFIGVVAIQNFWQRLYSYALIDKYVEDVKEEVGDGFNSIVHDWTYTFAEQLEENTDWSDEHLSILVHMNEEVLSEINIIDENGIIIHSSNPEYVGWDMSNGEQGSEFLCLLHGEEYYEQPLRPNDYDKSIEMIYAGKAFSKIKGFLELGFGKEKYTGFMNESLAASVRNRRIGFSGVMVLCDIDFTIIGATDDKYTDQKLDDSEIQQIAGQEKFQGELKLFDKKCYVVSIYSDGYYIIGGFPVNEAGFFGEIDKILNVIMIFVILVSISLILSKLLNKHVVGGIESITRSLSKITSGDLDEKVDVSSSLEFSELSNYINETVDRLKTMIIEADKRIDMELETARSIQQTSLPDCRDAFRRNRYFSLFACMETAKTVGGDYYDFYMLPDDVLVLTIADVSDKGIPAAMFMMRAKTLMKSLAEEGLSVEEMATAANKGLWENNEGSMFVTAWIGFIDLKTGNLRYVHAGHVCPVLIRDSKAEFIRKKRELLIGGMPDATYHGQELELKPGDTLFLYTDGMTEAEDPEGKLYGNDRLLSMLSSVSVDHDNTSETEYCEYVCKKAVAEVQSFCGDNPQTDDITVLCLRLEKWLT